MLWPSIMNVATRITVATAVVVALASAGYAIVDLRARRAERMEQLGREAKAVAGILRLTLESQSSAFRIPSDAQRRALEASSGGWKVKVVPRTRKDELPSDGPQRSRARVAADADRQPNLSRRRRLWRHLLLCDRVARGRADARWKNHRHARDLAPRRDHERRRRGPRDRADRADRRRHDAHGRRAREPVRQPADHEAPARHRRRREGRPVARHPLRARRRDRRRSRRGSTR